MNSTWTVCAFVSFLVGATAASAVEAKEEPAVEAPGFEFRLIALNGRYDGIRRAAVAQQNQESRDGKPLSDVVKLAPDSQDVQGHWVDVVATAQPALESLSSVLTRRIPTGKAGSATTKFQILVVDDRHDISSADIKQADVSFDSGGRPCVSFEMTEAGATKLRLLTSEHLPTATEFYHLGIIVGGRLYTAPRIQSAIEAHGVITGNFSEEELKAVADVLNGKAARAAAKAPAQSTD